MQIDEKEALVPGRCLRRMGVFYGSNNDVTWPFFGQIHGIDPLTAPLSLTPVAGGYAASADCIDLWPSVDQELPTQEQINNIEVVLGRWC